jgi:hypothetical protein
LKRIRSGFGIEKGGIRRKGEGEKGTIRRRENKNEEKVGMGFRSYRSR